HADWGTFVECFQQLSPEAQGRYLQRQGYARLADLLAHVIAWWQEGLQDIPAMLDDPGCTSPEHEVDLFNAQAVKEFDGVDEASVIVIFEDLRQQWLALVSNLPPEVFQHRQIADRLHIELIGHYAEHRL
ncbi:MAG TPA: hypothetical protein VLG46_07730, partial [Anaerolineae bacterium]|nr:hypothetical protein [Anaerolineae bacterium]